MSDNQSTNDIDELSKNVIVTSSYVVANREILKEIDFVTAECVYGMNLFRDIFAGARDVVGGRSVATQKVLRDAGKTAIAELRQEAAIIGADAVIATDLDFGNKGQMLFAVASGTAVKLFGAKKHQLMDSDA